MAGKSVSQNVSASTATCELPMALLMDGIEIGADGTAILFALWYGNGPLPKTVAERRGVFRHLVMEKRCKRLEIHGSIAQIKEIVHLGEYAPDIADFEAAIERKVRPIEELLKIAEQQKGTGLKWENLANPRGTSLSTEIRVKILGGEKEIAAHFEATQSDVKLQLAPAW